MNYQSLVRTAIAAQEAQRDLDMALDRYRQARAELKASREDAKTARTQMTRMRERLSMAARGEELGPVLVVDNVT